MKYIKKISAFFVMFLLVISCIGCKEEHTHKFVDGLCECGEKQQGEVVDVNYLNGHLNITGYKTLNYEKNITSNEVLLLEEKTVNSFDGSKYQVSSIVKKLNLNGEYETSSNEEEKSEASKLLLVLKEEYFENVLIKLDSFEADILDEYTNTFLGVDAKEAKIQVTFGKYFIVTSIVINYIDSESNFNVSIKTTYSYE